MDSDSDGEGTIKEGLSNILIIEGESATGKTAAVHACAAQLGFTVIEMNASHLRSTAAVLPVALSPSIIRMLLNPSFIIPSPSLSLSIHLKIVKRRLLVNGKKERGTNYTLVNYNRSYWT